MITPTLLHILPSHPNLFLILHPHPQSSTTGFGLFSDNMMQWASSHYILVVMAFDIMLGNTAFPVACRFIVWCIQHTRKEKDPALKLLLEHPRKCFTHLFGGVETRNLLLLLLGFTVAEFALSLGVEYDLEMYKPYNGATRCVIVFFQAISTRTAGFNAIDVSQLAASISVLSVLMMYLAVYPTLCKSIHKTDSSSSSWRI